MAQRFLTRIFYGVFGKPSDTAFIKIIRAFIGVIGWILLTSGSDLVNQLMGSTGWVVDWTRAEWVFKAALLPAIARCLPRLVTFFAAYSGLDLPATLEAPPKPKRAVRKPRKGNGNEKNNENS